MCLDELGQRLTNAFDEIGYSLEQFDWYLFPMEFKRILPMIMVIAQQPVELECFGSIKCSRIVFKKVSIKNSQKHTFYVRIPKYEQQVCFGPAR